MLHENPLDNHSEQSCYDHVSYHVHGEEETDKSEQFFVNFIFKYT